MTKTIDALVEAMEALELAQDNLRDHGDNCFLHDEGEYNACFCGKDSLVNHLQSVVEKSEAALAQARAEQSNSVEFGGIKTTPPAAPVASAEQAEPVPEGCTPKDAQLLRQANHGFVMENKMLRDALKFYADRNHFNIADCDAWDTVSGEPQNFWCDEAGTATVEDGTLAAMALRGTPLTDEDDTTPPAPVQAVEPLTAWQPRFEAMSHKQETLAVEFCAEIAGPRGQPGNPPDPVRLLEMAQALYEAERDDFAAAPPLPKGGR